MRLLVDGDIILYRAGFAAERTFWSVSYENAEYGEEITVQCDNNKAAKAVAAKLAEDGEEPTLHSVVKLEPVSSAVYNVRSMLERCFDAISPDEMQVVLSGDTNFRKRVAQQKEYKGNRKDSRKPQHNDSMREFMCKNFETIITDDEEADDWLGYTQYGEWKEDEYGSVIATIDKDLDMIPGLHYNIVDETAYHVTLEDGNRKFWQQLLSGDSTDNIPGVPGVGKVGAKKAVADCNTCEEYFEAAKALYVQGYEDNWRQVMLEMGQLIWIRRKPGEMWSPELMEEQYEPSVA